MTTLDTSTLSILSLKNIYYPVVKNVDKDALQTVLAPKKEKLIRLI